MTTDRLTRIREEKLNINYTTYKKLDVKPPSVRQLRKWKKLIKEVQMYYILQERDEYLNLIPTWIKINFPIDFSFPEGFPRGKHVKVVDNAQIAEYTVNRLLKFFYQYGYCKESASDLSKMKTKMAMHNTRLESELNNLLKIEGDENVE